MMASPLEKGRAIRRVLSRKQREFIMSTIASLEKIEQMEALTVVQVLSYARWVDDIEREQAA